MLSLLFGVKSFVTLLDEPFEQPVKHSLGHGTDGVGHLVDITTLCDELVTDLDLGFQQSGVQELAIYTQQFGYAFTILREKRGEYGEKGDEWGGCLPQYHQLQPVLHDPFV